MMDTLTLVIDTYQELNTKDDSANSFGSRERSECNVMEHIDVTNDIIGGPGKSWNPEPPDYDRLKRSIFCTLGLLFVLVEDGVMCLKSVFVNSMIQSYETWTLIFSSCPYIVSRPFFTRR
jgi:hypothetical protein